MENNHYNTYWKSFFIAVGAILTAVSLVVMFGWFTNNQALVQIQPQFASMKFNTAFGFFLCGTSLILLRFGRKTAVRYLSILLTVMATMSLSEWLLQIDLAIDNLFVVDQVEDPTSPPGLMSIPTALCFILSGLALFFLTLRHKSAIWMTLISVIGGIVLAIGLIGLIDYALSVFSDYGWQQYTVMAMHTTSSFCLIGSSLIVIAVLENHNKHVHFAKDFLPVATVLIMLCLSISIAIDNKNQQHNQRMLNKELDNQVEQIKLDAHYLLSTLAHSVKRWELKKGQISQSDWQADSQLYLDSMPFLQAISRVDNSFHPVWLVAGKNDIELNDLDSLRPELLKASQQNAEISYINTDEFKQTFFITIPLYVDQQFDGFMLALFDLKLLLKKIDGMDVDALYWLSVNVAGNRIYHSAGLQLELDQTASISRKTVVYHLPLTITSGYLASASMRGISLLSATVFVSGSLFVFLMLAAIYVYQKSRNVMVILSREKERFRLVIEAAPGAMILTNEDGTILLLNSKTENLFGYSHNELLGQNVDVLVPLSHRHNHKGLRDSYVQKPHLRAMGKGQDLFGLHKDGQLIPVEIELCPIKTAQETKVLASIFDLTERSKQLQALKRSKDELDRAGLLAKIGAWQFEFATKEVHWSAQTYKIHEVPVSTPISIEFAMSFFSKADCERLDQAIDEASSNGSEWDMQLSLTTAKGKKIWVRTQGQVEYENNQPVRAVGAIQDITEKHHNIMELERRNHELNNFAYVASHDLKSPLRGIDQLATWLEEDLAESLSGQTKEHLRLIRSRTNRMENLLDDLLAYARASRTDASIECVEITSLVEQVFVFCNNSGQFSLEIIGNSADYLVAKTPLETVLRNLINNAMKHHDQAQGKLTVTIRYENNRLQFNVADDGPGIPPEHRERAFAMFQTLQPRDKVEGSGMGLAIVRKMIESFEGTIDIKANQPRGVVFEFSWPATLNPQ